MSLFDSIRYPITILTAEELLRLPTPIFNKWFLKFEPTGKGNRQESIDGLRKMIAEWEEPNE